MFFSIYEESLLSLAQSLGHFIFYLTFRGYTRGSVRSNSYPIKIFRLQIHLKKIKIWRNHAIKLFSKYLKANSFVFYFICNIYFCAFTFLASIQYCYSIPLIYSNNITYNFSSCWCPASWVVWP